MEFLVTIKRDDLTGSEIKALLQEHLQSMRTHSPPESCHVLDIESLRKPEITFWTVWESGELLGCGALKEMDAHHAEIKSMRTSSLHLRKGVARKLRNADGGSSGRMCTESREVLVNTALRLTGPGWPNLCNWESLSAESPDPHEDKPEDPWRRHQGGLDGGGSPPPGPFLNSLSDALQPGMPQMP